jgi:hypothetical protein
MRVVDVGVREGGRRGSYVVRVGFSQSQPIVAPASPASSFANRAGAGCWGPIGRHLRPRHGQLRAPAASQHNELAPSATPATPPNHT